MIADHQAGPTLGQLSLNILRRFPDRLAFCWDGGQATYAETLDLLGRMQAVLAGFGLKRGDRMAILAANRLEAWCVGYAAVLQGLATTWLHPMGSLADQLAQLQDSGANALVIDTGQFAHRGGELANACAAQLNSAILTLGAADYGKDLIKLSDEIGTFGPRDFGSLGDIVSLNYTGGTTGKAKAAVYRHPTYIASITAVVAGFELPRAPRFLATAPISHVGGAFVLPTLADGGTVHLLPRFEADRVLASIERLRIDTTLFVPTMIYSLLDNPALSRTDLSSLELILYGASPMSPTRLWEALERIGPVFSQLYGQTEAFPICVLGKADHDPSRPDLVSSCGFATIGCQVQLLDEDSNPVQAGEAGEISVRAPFVMEEYLNRPELTAETLAGGWLRTSDIARTDEEGRLYIVDRKKDMIISGGFNIYPRDVEDALTSYQGVAMAAVIGVPDARWGECVRALVVRRAGAELSERELIEYVRTLKGSAHAPKQIEFVDALPVTSLGKVDKKVLRARHWAGQTRMVN